SLPLQLAQSPAQGEGILHRPRAGRSPFEEADPRALSQRRGDGRARLRSRSCRTNLLSHVSVRSISAASGADRRLFAQSTRNESRRAEFTPALAPADDSLEDAPMGLRRRAAYGEEASSGAAGHGDSRGAAANGDDGYYTDGNDEHAVIGRVAALGVRCLGTAFKKRRRAAALRRPPHSRSCHPRAALRLEEMQALRVERQID